MKPVELFDACHAKVRVCMYASTLKAVSMEPRTSGGPQRVGIVQSEYVADFKQAGRRALLEGRRRGRTPNPHEGQWELFLAYFMAFPPNAAFGEEITNAELLNYHGRRVRKNLRLKEGTFYRWIQQIKEKVGTELGRSGLFPPGSYSRRRVEPVVVDED